MKTIVNLIVVASMFVSQFSIPYASQVLAAKNTPTATATQTPAVTTTSSGGTATETPTIPPVETITPIPSETPTPPAPTVPPLETVPPVEPITILNLSATPDFVTHGGQVSIEWAVEYLQDKKPTDLTLQLSLPEGFEPAQKKNVDFNSENNTLTISASNQNGSIQVIAINASKEAVFFGSLFDADKNLVASANLIVPFREQLELNGNSSEVSARDGKLKVKFRENMLKAYADGMEIEIGTPAGKDAPSHSMSTKPFEIKAWTKKGKIELKQFDEPVEFEIGLADYGFTNVQTGDVFLYWYNPETGEWLGMPSWVDEATNTLHSETDHFSIFDIGANNWEASKIPSVNAFQVASFTGAATYSLPIEVPQGPGGLVPSLSLNYNSQVIDQATNLSQAGWVGMGWSLETGYIELNTHNDSNPVGDSYFLNLNGISTEIISTSDGYHASDENFMKISFNGTKWIIWDKQGNSYEFAHQTNMRYSTGRNCDSGGGTSLAETTNRWSLTSVTNIFGKKLNFAYENETKEIKFYTWSAAHGECRLYGLTNTDTATYLKTITYPNERIQVQFIREARSDYDHSYENDYIHHSFERSRLDRIMIMQDTDGNTEFETIIRKYDLTYSTTSNQIWPNAGNPSALASVQEYGVGGTTPLPAVTFTYGDYMHLTQADNGYGGVVTFAYESWYFWRARESYERIFTGDFRAFPASSGVLPYSGGVIKPGGAYYMDAGVGSGQVLQLRLFDGYAYQYTAAVNNPSGFFILPATASSTATNAQFVNPSGSQTVHIYAGQFSPMTTIYRVTTRTVYDGLGNQYPTTFSYSGPAVNDDAHSAGSTANSSYTEKFSEFRGHAQVTETGSDGRQILTSYYQDDIYKGMSYNTQVKYGNKKINETISSYSFTQLEGSVNGDKNTPRYWVKQDSTESRIYNNDGVNFSFSKTVNTYEPTYGNLTEVKEYENNSTTPYRRTTTDYFPNNTSTRYLVSLPAKTKVFGGNNNDLGATTVYLYDGNTGSYAVAPVDGKLTAIRTRANGAGYSQVSYGYDLSWGNRISETTYSSFGAWDSSPSLLDARKTTIEYDLTYHTYPISITTPPTQNAPQGIITTSDYDYTLGLPLVETDPNGAQTRAQYDSFGRIINVYRPDPATGAPVTTASLSMTYSSSYPFTTSITQHVKDSTFYTITRLYDGMGRQTTSIEYPGLPVPLTVMAGPNYIYTDTEYVSATITKQSMPHLLNETALYTTTTSNIAARTVTVAAPDDTSTITTTDGLVTTVRDARGYDTKTITDVWGRTISVVPPTGTGPSLRYIYDPLGNMTYTIRGLDASINSSTCLNNPTSANCPSSTITALTYYEAGQKSSMTDPDMGAWSYEYDALGNLTKQTDARQCVTNLGYDTLNRLTTKTYANCPTTPNVNYYYDGQSFTFNGTTYNSYTNAIGRRSGMVMSGSNAAAWNYDMRGRATKETKVISTNSYITEWGYNSADLPTWMEYPDNEVVNYTYNSRMLLNSVSGTNTYVTSTGYDLAGRMTSRALGNTLTQAFTYNPWNIQGGRLQNLATGTLQNLSYTYDEVGNIKTITDARNANQKQCFQYDPLGRLTKATTYNDAFQWCTSQLGAGNYNEIYTYNGTTGNLQAKAGVTLTYPTGNNPTRPHAVTSTNNATTLTTADDNSYSYDANGNMFTRTVLAPIVGNPNNKDVFDLSYDAENRLVQVKKNNVLNATFTYDGDGRRVISVIGSETIHFVGAHFEVTNPGSGQTVTKYYLAGASRIAMRKYTVPQNMTVEYLLGDHLGSTNLTADSMGAKVSEIRYKPWGEIRYSWKDTQLTPPAYSLMDYTFTGQYSYMDDPTTSGTTEGFGLMFYNARWYDPAIGRFAQADSIIPPSVQGYDRYAYTNNNPLRYTDPSGHESVCGQANSDSECGELGHSPLSHPSGGIRSDYRKKSKDLSTVTQYDYHQCMNVCHQNNDSGPTNYIDIYIDPSKIDGISIASNGLGLIGDGITAITILDGPVIGDEVGAVAGFTTLNSVTTGINIFSVGADVYQAAFDGKSPMTAVRDGTLTVATLPKVLPKIAKKVPVLGKILPLFSLPFHLQGLAESFSPGLIYTIPLGDAP